MTAGAAVPATVYIIHKFGKRKSEVVYGLVN